MSTPSPSWISADHVVLPCPDQGLTLGPAALRVEGARITHVQAAPPPGQACMHLAGKLLSPAWINAHTHLPMTCFRALDVEGSTQVNVVEDLFFRLEAAMGDEDIAAFARVGAYESLMHGVGLVWEHYYGGLGLAQAIASTGLCAVVAPTLQDLEGPGKTRWEAQLEATAQIDDSAELARRGVFAALGPHATDTVSPALWERLLEQAQARALPVHVHVAQSIQEVERAWARHQTSPVGLLERVGALERAPHLTLIHAIYLSRGDLARLDASRHTLGFCPYSQLIFNFPARAQAWRDAGLPWFVATDCAASNDSMSVQQELRYVAGMAVAETTSSEPLLRFLESGSLADAASVDAHRAQRHQARRPLADERALLERVWSTPGRMHPKVKAGQVAPGHLANLLVWDLEHPTLWPGQRPLRSLAYGDTSQAIEAMMVGGRWLGRPSELGRSPGYQEACREALGRLRALAARAQVTLG